MKKIISLGIASAVLALTAMTASAGVVVDTTDAITPGATIKVTFTTDSAITYASFKTEATGMTLVSATSPLINPDVPANEQMTQIVDNNKFGTINAQAAGTVLMVQTYTVTAAAGQPVTVNIVDAEGLTGTNVNMTYEVKDPSAVTPSDSGSSETPSDSGSSETPSDSGSSETPSGSETPSDSESKPGDDKSPTTGVALAVFPAIIAGAAVVVAKKRK